SDNLGIACRTWPVGSVAPLQSPSATLPQPFFPGVGGQAVAGDSTVLDPDYKPEKVDTWDFTIQRQISRKLSFEAGYMGKRSRNIFEEIDLDAVPYMMTLGGQSFATAFANVWKGLCAPGAGGRCSQVDLAGSAGLAA